MKIPFVKMSGAGNDFVVVDNRTGIIKDASSFTIHACERRFGVGADGVLMLESCDSAAFEMKYYNADGSNAGMCGNGGRCLAKFAYDSGVVKSSEFTFLAFGHLYTAVREEENVYELFMKQPHGHRSSEDVVLDDRSIRSHYLNTGTDHAVVFIDENPGIGSLSDADIVGIGRAMRYHAVYGPIGTNVNFVQKDTGNRITIRTYERGVEDETLACGTGSVASALLSTIRYDLSSPVEVIVKSGKRLRISFEKIGKGFTNVRLQGPSIVTFRGELEYHI